MFERFTDRARRVLVIAQEEARSLEHNFIGTEHLLLGMLREGEGVAAKALVELGADLEAVRAEVVSIVAPGAPGTAEDRPPFTPRSKKVLELALREALSLNHNYIGTEHLLLGLVREGEGVASQVLQASNLDEAAIRGKVVELLQGYGAPSNPGTAAAGPATPAGEAIPGKARLRAAGSPVGSHHYLLALFEDRDSAAARVLESLGVTEASVAARIAAMGTAGTSDEVTPKAPVVYDFRLGDGFTLKIEDRVLAEALRSTIGEGAGQGAPGELTAILRKALADYLQPPSEPTSAPGSEAGEGPTEGDGAGEGGDTPPA